MELTSLTIDIQAFTQDGILLKSIPIAFDPDNFDSVTGEYIVTVNAPEMSSYNLRNNVFDVIVNATTVAGADSETTTLRVYENKVPTIEFTNPKNENLSSLDFIEVQISDNFLGDEIFNEEIIVSKDSGINLNTVSVNLSKDGQVVNIEKDELTSEEKDGVFIGKYTPKNEFTEGSYKITVSASDFDGNFSGEITKTFVIDQKAPIITLTSPEDGITITQNYVTVAGTLDDPEATISVTLNGVNYSEIQAENGVFSSNITSLSDGDYTLIITAIDKAGNTSQETRRFKISTAAPVIHSVEFVPLSGDKITQGNMYKIIVKVGIE